MRIRARKGLLPRARVLALGAVLAGASAVAAQLSAAAAFEAYVSGSNGYDYSYVQCGSSAPAASFAIVGVNAGYPFTYYNGCLAGEFAAAEGTGNAALYINTGYDPTYTAVDGRHSTSECVTQSSAVTGSASQQSAWAVGCSEAQRDLAYAGSQSATPPAAWWLDVETANSWSTSDLSLNRYTIKGIIDRLRASTSVPVGIYSTPYQWNSITGGYAAPADANWVATGARTVKRARSFCGDPGFTGAPVWLVQYVQGYDRDFVC